MGQVVYLGLCLLGCLLFNPSVEVPQAKSRCPVGTYYFKDGLSSFCYEFYEYALTFEEAEAVCQNNRNGGHLASITSDTQTRLIGGYLSLVNQDKAYVWIGLHRRQNTDTNSRWRWTDGLYFLYTNWHTRSSSHGEDKFCAVLRPGSGFKSWEAASCSSERPFLCKWRAP